MSSARYITTTDTAKLVRKALKVAFPAVKFSVRSSTYSMGSSINIAWTDGPTDNQVTEVVYPFQSGRFDGTIDLAYNADAWLCQHGVNVAQTYGHSYASENGPEHAPHCESAELVHFSAKHVNVERAWSPEFTARMEAKVAELCGQPYQPLASVNGEYMKHLVWRAAREVSA